MRLFHVHALGLIASLLAFGCGGATHPPRVSAPFTQEDARVFDGAVDLVGEPAILEGRWFDDWMSDLVQRVRAADVVATVTIRTLRTDTDLERRETYRLLGAVDDVLVGNRLDDVVLRVRQDERGFDTITGKERRILERRFVVFIKWAQPDPDGEVIPRWHLSPATPDVLNQVNAAIARRERAEARERAQR